MNRIARRPLLCLAAFACIVAPLDAQTSSPLTDAQVSARVDHLLAQMTTEEKIGQLSQEADMGQPANFDERVRKGELGSLLFVTDPHTINTLQHAAVEGSRLHIPLIFGFDVIHGYRTIFPVPIAMAASWDPAMVEHAQSIAAKEANAGGIHWAFAPMLDIALDPRWGRIIEGSGSDPYLGSAMAVAQVRGFQGPYIGAPGHILACMKHFAGYGYAEGGRDYEESHISDADLQNVVLPPFHAAVKAGVGSAMSAYMDLNDVPATGNRWLLHDVLRDEWGFKGFVVSDWDAVKSLQIHGFAADPADAAARALNAGVDMEMSFGPAAMWQTLANSLKQGRVSMAEIEAADRRILEAKVRLGLFEHPYVDESNVNAVLNAPEHREAARITAERSAVLLRNQDGILPLDPARLKRVAVIGPLADSKFDTLGSWAFQENVDETVTVLDGLKAKLGSGAQVSFTPGVQIPPRLNKSPFDALMHVANEQPWTPEQSSAERDKAVRLAQQSDVTILVLGEREIMSGESASRATLRLPGEQDQLLQAVVATGKPVVLVLMNGRPLDLRWASQHAPAILEVWYPGTQGGAAVANLLTGAAVPGGKLPFDWPRDEAQIPLHYDHNTTQSPESANKRYWDEPGGALYPFGYGLSYATFTVSDLQVATSSVHPGQPVQVSAVVENTSGITADAVPQIYIHQKYGSASRPVRQLKGFERITLAPHAKQTVTFTLTGDDLRYWSAASHSWVNDAAPFDVWVGQDSTASLHGSFEVK